MKKFTAFSFLLVTSMILFSACSGSSSKSATSTSESTTKTSTPITSLQGEPMKQLSDFEKNDATHAVIKTNKGDIAVELYPDLAPVTVASFLDLSGKKFYDGIIVHRVEPGFVIQAGDPKTKEQGKEAEWGTGGPGYTVPDEFSDYKYDQEGILAMAKTMAPNSGGSQFFITLGPAEFLNNSYTVFGKVTSGMDIVKSIKVGDTIETVEIGD